MAAHPDALAHQWKIPAVQILGLPIRLTLPRESNARSFLRP
jgi:hypothetical protein